jgi:hypothetical protein
MALVLGHFDPAASFSSPWGEEMVLLAFLLTALCFTQVQGL